MQEVWKDYIPNFYQISNLGNIKSVDRSVLFNGTPGLRKGIPIKQTINSKGYQTVVICVNGERSTEHTHRIVATVFHENPLNKPEVNHKDCNTLNNHENNLEWITREDNLLHAYENGAISAGNVKLTAHEVSEIKLLIHRGFCNPEIGKMFGVSRSTIRQIRIGKNWTHIKMAVESRT